MMMMDPASSGGGPGEPSSAPGTSPDTDGDTTPKPRPVATSELEIIESKIRSHVYSARIRISEYYKDYDRLHSGFISYGQFRRCLSMSIEKGPQLSDGEYGVLQRHYDTRGNGTVNYSAFIESVDKVFGERYLEKTPTLSVEAPGAWIKDIRPLSPKTQARCLELIDRIRAYVRHHGFDVKSWYRDFDKHNSGFVTVNQYRRGFPASLLTAEEIDTLLVMYKDHGTDTVNYFKFNVHVNRKVRPPRVEPSNRLVPQKAADEHPMRAPVGTEVLLESNDPSPRTVPTAAAALAHIQKLVYVQRIRLVDLFRDYDRHNLGLVTENQFRAAMKQAELLISRAETDAVVAAFRCADGRVSYRDFCAQVDEIFTSHKVEADPTFQLAPPDREALIKHTNTLSAEDEAIYAQVIERLQQQIGRRRINMMSFFKDLDRRAGGCGQITKSQFARLLSLAGLEISQKELYVLLDKHQDPYHVNYINFVHEVDASTKRRDSTNQYETIEPLVIPDRSLGDLLDTIQRQVYMKGLRMCEFLRDFDRSKTGTISRPDFVRALNHMGLQLTPGEAQTLADHFMAPDKPERCRWRDFERHVEEAHGHYTDLEKTPTLRVVPPALANPAEHPHTRPLAAVEHVQLRETLVSLRAHLQRRSTSMKPQFHSFDKLRTGRVTRAQLRQVLSWVEAEVSDAAFELICRNWTDVGFGDFCYQPFIALVEAQDPLAPVDTPPLGPRPGDQAAPGCPSVNKMLHSGMPIDVGRASAIPAAGCGLTTGTGGGVVAMAALARPAPLPRIPDDDLDALLLRMKSKVKTERIRVYDALRDFDGLNCGRITRGEFERALDWLSFQLDRVEIASVADRYAVARGGSGGGSGRNPLAGLVNYRAFSDDMEAVFTQKHLERTPTAKVAEFKPLWHEHGQPRAVALPQGAGGACIAGGAGRGNEAWGPSHDAALSQLMHSLAEDLRQRRMYFLLRYLEDHDKIHNGTITRTQFMSAMSAAGCELMEADVALIVAHYALQDHDDNIDYLSFNRDLTEMSKQVWKKGETASIAEAVEARRRASAAASPAPSSRGSAV
ncbi:hypothetical protein H9P43_006090 [Blastocladiella emersonii ATCC 22665]|nr:hypothetical protein H9P43_006090 [Blastocladiella emersonii ATCC 22665]